MERSSFDLLVIGSGPGGYVGAIRAAQLGMKVGVVERAEVGGVCLNWGCIPTKALLKSAEVVETIRRSKEFGVASSGCDVDFPAVIKRSRDVAKRVSMGVNYLLKKNEIPLISGTARFRSPVEVGVFDESGGEVHAVSAKKTLLATGGRARAVPGIAIDGEKVISYREAMTLESRPESMVVIGAGAIGMEFAWFYNTLGTKITVVEMLDNVLPIEDPEVSKVVEKAYKKRKMKILCGHMVSGVETEGGGVTVRVKDKAGEEKAVEGDLALMAIGIQGNVEGLGLEEIGVEVDRGFVKVGAEPGPAGRYRTAVESVFAIGDVIGPPLLAHVASHEAILCVEGIAGLEPEPMNYDAIPGCTFCHPQVGSIGFSEAAAKEAGHEVKVGKFPFMGVGKAVAAGEREGFVKLVFDAGSDKILGGHIVGPEAAELVGELEIAAAQGLTWSEIGHAIHSHPTFHEAIMEAALAAGGRAIHI